MAHITSWTWRKEGWFRSLGHTLLSYLMSWPSIQHLRIDSNPHFDDRRSNQWSRRPPPMWPGLNWIEEDDIVGVNITPFNIPPFSHMCCVGMTSKLCDMHSVNLFLLMQNQVTFELLELYLFVYVACKSKMSEVFRYLHISMRKKCRRAADAHHWATFWKNLYGFAQF